jgi:uncharacterized membrane protein YedE/YeeE
MRVPRLEPVRKRNRRDAWPEALVFAGLILLVAALASAFITPSLRLLVLGGALVAVAGCVQIAAWKRRPG